jgi:hypothetical protein
MKILVAVYSLDFAFPCAVQFLPHFSVNLLLENYTKLIPDLVGSSGSRSLVCHFSSVMR